MVEPARQATFEYAFTPSETFNARPFGLTINLNYKDAVSEITRKTSRLRYVNLCLCEKESCFGFVLQEGNFFQDAVFNETINIVDADEGLDGET